MFGRRKRIKSNKVDSFIGAHTELNGDIRFSEDLLILGTVHGNVLADEGSQSVLKLAESGRVEGDIRVPNVVVNGVVVGDVYATEHVHLGEGARINGDVYYQLIEVAFGAEVNGNLVHIGDQLELRLKLGHEPGEGQRAALPGGAAGPALDAPGGGGERDG